MPINCMRMEFLVKLHRFLPKLYAYAIYQVIQSYCVVCRSTRLDLSNVVLWNEHKQKISKRLIKRSVSGLLVYFSEKLV